MEENNIGNGKHFAMRLRNWFKTQRVFLPLIMKLQFNPKATLKLKRIMAI